MNNNKVIVISNFVYDIRNRLLTIVTEDNKNNIEYIYTKIDDKGKNISRNNFIVYIRTYYEVKENDSKENFDCFVTGFKAIKIRNKNTVIKTREMMEMIKRSIVYFKNNNKIKHMKAILLFKDYVLSIYQKILFYMKKVEDETKRSESEERKSLMRLNIKDRVCFYHPKVHIIKLKDIIEGNKDDNNLSVRYYKPVKYNIDKTPNESFLLNEEESSKVNESSFKLNRNKSSLCILPKLIIGFNNNAKNVDEIIIKDKYKRYLNKIKARDLSTFIKERELDERLNQKEYKKQKERDEKYLKYLKKEKMKALAKEKGKQVDFLHYS